MEIGTEISHKIRSAIKAKLVELGSYIDEELPDYIMVMVANKKSFKQMTDDLELFLGPQTEVFTAWLHDLLKKLQSIGGDQNPKKNVKPEDETENQLCNQNQSSENSSCSSEANQDQSGENADKAEKVEGNLNESAEVDTSNVKKDEMGEPVSVSKRKDANIKADCHQDVTNEPAASKVQKVQPTAVAIEEENEPELLVRADTDEFTEELQIEEEKMPASSNGAISKVSASISEESNKKISTTTGVKSNRTAVVKKSTIVPTFEVPKRESKPDISSRLGIKHEIKRAVASPIRQTSSSTSRQVAINRKRREPSSVIGSVIDNNCDDEEEEYDPLNPVVGSVASTVKVTARKSSIPQSLQANKSLLMRAVTEAEKSVNVKRPIGRAVKSTASQVVVHPLRREVCEEPVSKQPRLTLTSRSRQDVYQRLKITTDNVEDTQPKYVIRKEEVYQPVFVKRASDNRVVEYITQNMHENIRSPNENIIVTKPQPVLIESIEDDYSSEETVIPISRLVSQEKTVFSPKFVVTLDGVSPNEYQEETDADISMNNSVQMATDSSKNRVNAPKIKPFSISLKDSDDEDRDEEMTPLEQVKATERCKFWPACANGSACQYHHPTVPCKTFPNCKYGEKCLYIHPNCKYDAKCSRQDCPYTHATRRLGIAGGAAKAVPFHPVVVPSYVPPATKQCIYFPNCCNMNCPFYHPTPCRFGLACRNKFCKHYHPGIPNRDKLKWSAQSTSETKQKG